MDSDLSINLEIKMTKILPAESARELEVGPGDEQ